MGAHAERLAQYNKGGSTSSSSGNSSFEITQNTSTIEQWIQGIEDTDLIRKIAYHAIVEGAMVLKHFAEEGFRKKLGAAAEHPSPHLGGQPFYKGVWIKGNKVDTVKVSIMKDYRVKWFEGGTEDRWIQNKSHSDLRRGRRNKDTGKSNFRGKIDKAKYGGWFKQARTENANVITEAVIQSINRAMEKLGRGEKL